METPLHLDELDFEILKRIQEHAKLTNVQLAEEINLSPASTLERVRKLEKKGVIKSYHAKLAPQKLALHTQIIAQIKLQRTTAHDVAAFQKAVAVVPDVVECHQVVGHTDFVLKIVTQSLTTYQQLIMHQLSATNNIQSLDTLVITTTFKETGLPIS